MAVSDKTLVEFAAMSEADQITWVRSCTPEQRAALIAAGAGDRHYPHLACAERAAGRQYTAELDAWRQRKHAGTRPEFAL